jgi:hypothetical protein
MTFGTFSCLGSDPAPASGRGRARPRRPWPHPRVGGAAMTTLHGPFVPPAARRALATPTYLRVLGWAFTLFNSVRVLSYLPTLWAIQVHGDSSQHSLWTWGTWLGANATMALWLYEQNGRAVNRAVMVNAGNAVMCLTTCVLIAAQRW